MKTSRKEKTEFDKIIEHFIKKVSKTDIFCKVMPHVETLEGTCSIGEIHSISYIMDWRINNLVDIEKIIVAIAIRAKYYESDYKCFIVNVNFNKRIKKNVEDSALQALQFTKVFEYEGNQGYVHTYMIKSKDIVLKFLPVLRTIYNKICVE
jgi:hypothetical protein